MKVERNLWNVGTDILIHLKPREATISHSSFFTSTEMQYRLEAGSHLHASEYVKLKVSCTFNMAT